MIVVLLELIVAGIWIGSAALVVLAVVLPALMIVAAVVWEALGRWRRKS